MTHDTPKEKSPKTQRPLEDLSKMPNAMFSKSVIIAGVVLYLYCSGTVACAESKLKSDLMHTYRTPDRGLS